MLVKNDVEICRASAKTQPVLETRKTSLKNNYCSHRVSHFLTNVIIKHPRLISFHAVCARSFLAVSNRHWLQTSSGTHKLLHVVKLGSRVFGTSDSQMRGFIMLSDKPLLLLRNITLGLEVSPAAQKSDAP